MVFYFYNCVSAHAQYARVKELLQEKQNFAAKMQRFDKKSKKYAATNAAKKLRQGSAQELWPAIAPEYRPRAAP